LPGNASAAKMRAMRRFLVTLGFLLAFPLPVRGDEYHYNDVFMGPRASGLGGTMIGIADDPSAAWYNPAGLAHAEREMVSLSTTALLGKVLTLEGYLGGDLDLESAAAFSPASVTTWPLLAGRFAFMGVTPSQDAYRVNRVIDQPVPDSHLLEASISRERSDSTYQVGVAYGQEIGRDIDLGVALCYVYRSYREHRSDFQHFSVADSQGNVAFEHTFDEKGISHGAILVAGLLFHPGGHDGPFRLGLTARTGANVSNSAFLRQTTFRGKPAADDPERVVYDRVPNDDLKKADSKIPPTLGLGLAWRPLPGWTIAVDGMLHGFVEYESYGYTVSKLSTFNGSFGTEVRLTEDFAARLGAFTNRTSATRDVKSSDLRPDSWDQYGGTVGVTLFGKYHSLSAALKYARMTGKATMPMGGDFEVIDVSGREIGVVFGGSYYF